MRGGKELSGSRMIADTERVLSLCWAPLCAKGSSFPGESYMEGRGVRKQHMGDSEGCYCGLQEERERPLKAGVIIMTNHSLHLLYAQ